MKENNKSPPGESWAEYKETLLTEDERREIDMKTRLMSAILSARKENGITQKELEKVSGVKQPVIARVENGKTDPQLSTLLKILNSLGKTIAIVPLSKKLV
jgi:predicted transcriptional regulator